MEATAAGVRQGRDWTRRTRIGLVALIAIGLMIPAGWLPVGAADDGAGEEAPIGTVWGGSEPYEYSSILIEWDREEGVYRSGEDEEGSFAYLLTMPGAQDWELVTILTESWFETSLDDRAAWDVFRWRAVYRRPLDLTGQPVE